MTRTRAGAIGLLTAIFALGLVAGGVGLRTWERSRAAAGRHSTGREAYFARLSTELGLTTVQQDSLRAIVRRNEPVMDSMWQEIRPRFDSVRVRMRDEIRAQLTPDQQQKYTEMIERREREYRARRANRE
jgi:hypothetical protein